MNIKRATKNGRSHFKSKSAQSVSISILHVFNFSRWATGIRKRLAKGMINSYDSNIQSHITYFFSFLSKISTDLLLLVDC